MNDTTNDLMATAQSVQLLRSEMLELHREQRADLFVCVTVLFLAIVITQAFTLTIRKS